MYNTREEDHQRENQKLRNRIDELEERISELKNQHAITVSDRDYLTVLSHEIRTPLNIVVGISDLLLNGNPKQEQVQNLKSLAFSARNMMNLVNNILDYNKIRSGRISVRQVDFNLKETVNELEQSYSIHAEKNNNQLNFHVDEKIPEIVRGDRLKLLQVLSNLLNNALKFTQDGSVLLALEHLGESDTTVDIRFNIKDTGPGISKKDIEQIFERFERTDDSITRRVGGTGLGLFMVDRLLRIMNSEIKVSSELGKGTDFHFKITLDKPLEKARKQGDHHDQEGLSGDLKILIAEDLEEHRQVLRQYLEQQDKIDYQIVANGKEAITEIQSMTYDIVFLDIKMPQANGHEVVRQVRALDDKYFKELPMIALTADVFGIEEMSKYFTDIVTKPFKFRQLMEMIKKYV
jgi:CheY-like chemotaxis protein